MKNKMLIGLGVAFLVNWVGSLVFTSDLNNWLLENVLVVGFLGALLITRKRYPFSKTTYALIAIFLCLHVHGSMHTYAEAPVGYWLSDLLGWTRNNFDRIVHFSFGLLLAYPIQELLRKYIRVKKWAGYILPAEIILSLSGLYELIEWSVAEIFFPEQGIAYLGSQGDVWDAQKDMGLAFVGAIISMLVVFVYNKIKKRTVKSEQLELDLSS